MATWGVKVSDELKEKLSTSMQESGLEGQDFAEQLYTLYATEILKKEKPALAQELEELQKLTQRIYNIYLNSNERMDNLLQAKEEQFKGFETKFENEITILKSELSSKSDDFSSLQEAYNNLANDKNEVDERIAELTDTIRTKQELVDQYKEKNDTLAGLISEYKGYKDENQKLKELIEQKTSELLKSQATINSLENELSKSQNSIEFIVNDNKEKIEALQGIHQNEIEKVKGFYELEKGKAILEIEQTHQKELANNNEKFNTKLENLTDKLEAERELNINLKEELMLYKKNPSTKAQKNKK